MNEWINEPTKKKQKMRKQIINFTAQYWRNDCYRIEIFVICICHLIILNNNNKNIYDSIDW